MRLTSFIKYKESPECNVSFVKINVSKCMEDEHERKRHGIKEMVSKEGYIKMVAECVIPSHVKPGAHVLKIIPMAYSEAIVLPKGETNFVIYKMVSIIEILMSCFSFPLA